MYVLLAIGVLLHRIVPHKVESWFTQVMCTSRGVTYVATETDKNVMKLHKPLL